MTAIEQLTSAYLRREGIGTAGVTSNTVPWEILEAAGFAPVLLNPPPGPTPLADHYMEDVFDPRMRGILEGLLVERWPDLRVVVIPRTSEQEHKLFLYLRELQRQGVIHERLQIVLYNLLQSESPEAKAYGCERTRELMKLLGGESRELNLAIERGNHARDALRRIIALREGLRVAGSEALPLLGAHYFLPRDTFADLAHRAADHLASRDPINRPRVLIKGSPLDRVDLHRTIESYGAIVNGEDDWWGSRILTEQIDTTGDVLANLFEAYYAAPGPRMRDDRWFHERAARADGVVFYLAPDDDVLGWDYPAWRGYLDSRSIPHVLIRDSAAEAGRCIESAQAASESVVREFNKSAQAASESVVREFIESAQAAEARPETGEALARSPGQSESVVREFIKRLPHA